MADHVKNLALLCRICGSNMKKESSFVENRRELILETVFIDISRDDPNVHPKKVCYKGISGLKNSQKRNSSPSVIIFEWRHSDDFVVV